MGSVHQDLYLKYERRVVIISIPTTDLKANLILTLKTEMFKVNNKGYDESCSPRPTCDVWKSASSIVFPQWTKSHKLNQSVFIHRIVKYKTEIKLLYFKCIFLVTIQYGSCLPIGREVWTSFCGNSKAPYRDNFVRLSVRPSVTFCWCHVCSSEH